MDFSSLRLKDGADFNVFSFMNDFLLCSSTDDLKELIEDILVRFVDGERCLEDIASLLFSSLKDLFRDGLTCLSNWFKSLKIDSFFFQPFFRYIPDDNLICQHIC